MTSNPALIAANLLRDLGIDNPAQLNIEDLITYFDGIVQTIPLSNCEGRMVMKKGKSIVSINADIEFSQKRRYVLAHELGHMRMHGGTEATFSDDYNTLEGYKNGPQEVEANDFAAHLLMPTNLFQAACFRKKFSPDLVRDLAGIFNTSLTSTVYRYIEIGSHPIAAFFSKDSKVVYWKKSKIFYAKVQDRTKLAVPSDSVANEYYVYKRIYQKKDSAQEILKSTWFELNEYERDKKMYEYCIITPQYNTVLSVIWED